jgi:kynureninase
MTAALWDQDVIPDFRAPQGIRIGLSPLSTSFEELYRGVAAIRELLAGPENGSASLDGAAGGAASFDKTADVPLN